MPYIGATIEPGRSISAYAKRGFLVAKRAVLLVQEAAEDQMRTTAKRDGVVPAMGTRAGDWVDGVAEPTTFGSSKSTS